MKHSPYRLAGLMPMFALAAALQGSPAVAQTTAMQEHMQMMQQHMGMMQRMMGMQPATPPAAPK